MSGRRWAVVAVIAVVALAGLWIAHANNVRQDRKAQGIDLCDSKIRTQLTKDYEPRIDVQFYEVNPDGDFLYDAYASDGDGDWSCKITWNGAKSDVAVADGTYQSSDEKNGWP